MKKYYVTTPIYYTNGLPHIGHAYSTFLADVLARYKRLTGHQVKFATGTDENSQKIVNKAAELGKDVTEYLDEAAEMWIDTWQQLGISYTDFIRTTQDNHKQNVQNVLQITHDNGDIYQGVYTGYYCEGCEAFKKSSDLTEDGKCPVHLTDPKELNENNRFFKLSKYEQALLDHYKAQPDFCRPHFRFNEVISFVEGGLEDFSVSRESNKIGIPLPFDPEHVTYVWYDALLNYLTVCQPDLTFWDEDTKIVHVMAKDITRFHAIYWPAMLMSAGYRLPDQVLITGYLTLKDHKISKSLGNVVNPVDWANDFDRDAILMYLFGDLSIGSDGSITEERLHDVYKSILMGGWGNLVNRLTNLALKYEITTGEFDEALHQEFMTGLDNNTIAQSMNQPWSNELLDKKYFDTYELKSFLEDWYACVNRTNELLQHKEPWKTYKDEATRPQALKVVSYGLWLAKQMGIVSAPVLINGFAKLQEALGNEDLQSLTTLETIDPDVLATIRGASTYAVNPAKVMFYEPPKVATEE